MFKKANIIKYMQACKEINIAFVPYEEQVIIYILKNQKKIINHPLRNNKLNNSNNY